ncbi:MAG: glucokinase [Ferrovibrio sp.]|uniref:glucokinase n=1 Tax=Ferrovibrio sp. TaxID=1917215 RepID=UPI00391C1F86
MSNPRSILLGDIGGTNLRFAQVAHGTCGPVTTLPRAAYGDMGEAIAAYLDASASPAPDRLVLAIAGPMRDSCVTMTNAAWRIDAVELQQRLRIPSVHLVNDFVATAWSLPALSANDVHQIGGGPPKPGGVKVACGPGTGLGTSAFIPLDGCERVIASEAGHITLAAQNTDEDAVLVWLREKFGHVSAERVISGPGLVNLHQALAALSQSSAPIKPAAEIVAAAREGRCELCARALALFCAFLGGFAGDLALTFGGRGGLYLTGGILPHMVDLLQASDFRQRFEAKGRLRDYLAPIPAFVILHPEPAILGLQAMIAAGHFQQATL